MTRYEIEFYARVTTVVEAEDAGHAFQMAAEAQRVAVTSPCPRTVQMPCGLPDAVVKLSTCTPRVIREDQLVPDDDPGRQCVS